jgi:outer membrane murein-binding lipoprotein Lpp
MISAILSSPVIVALLGGFVAAVAAYLRGRVAGKKLQEAKQTAEKLRAAEDRLEMDREATAEERKASAMSDDEARREAMRWAKR